MEAEIDRVRDELAGHWRLDIGDALGQTDVPSVTVVKFRSGFDGTEQVYLQTAPPVPATGRPVDLVLYFHGMSGTAATPFVRKDGLDESFAHFCLSNGWMVVSPDYRLGSWLNEPATADITLIIRRLRRDLPVRHLVFAGGSMGGMAALTYPILAPSDCQADGIFASAPATDMTVQWRETGSHHIREVIEHAYGGTPETVPEVYRSRSVLRHLERFPARIPVAIVYKTQDEEVPPAQARQFAAALRQRGQQKVKLIPSPGGHHSPLDFREPLEWVWRNLR